MLSVSCEPAVRGSGPAGEGVVGRREKLDAVEDVRNSLGDKTGGWEELGDQGVTL